MNNEQKKMNNKGFSLVELIIVIAIMAILVGVLAPQYVRYIAKSKISTDMQNVQAIRTSVEAYAAEAGSLSANVVVKVSGGSITVTGLDATTLNTIGISGSTTCKGTWAGDGTYTLDKSSLTWSGASSTACTSTVNGKTYRMGSVFDSSIQSEDNASGGSPTPTPNP